MLQECDAREFPRPELGAIEGVVQLVGARSEADVSPLVDDRSDFRRPLCPTVRQLFPHCGELWCARPDSTVDACEHVSGILECAETAKPAEGFTGDVDLWAVVLRHLVDFLQHPMDKGVASRDWGFVVR